MLEVYEIDVFYGKFQVLRDVSLRVDDGEYVAILGPNGHGKSTLFKTICGLLTPTSGYIKFNNEKINGLPSKEIVERGLVYIPDSGHIFPEMTVKENLKLGAYNTRARQKQDANFDYVFQLFPSLKKFEKRLASTLSGGERKMLALGRGLMSDAKFLLVDEPSLGLSPYLRAEVFQKINLINKKGTSILLVEQNVAEALDFVNRVYVIENGRIVFEGQKEEAISDEHIKKVFLGM